LDISEIAMTNLVKKRRLQEYRGNLIKKAFSFDSVQNAEELSIKYNVTLDHLCYLNQTDLDWWGEKLHNEEHPLDTLYKNKKIFIDKIIQY
jgi:hypothetical protein